MRILPKQPGFHEMSSVVFFRILFRKSFQHFLRHRRRCNGLLRLSATRRHCVVAFHVMLSDLWASLEAQLLAAPILAMHTRQITRSPYCHSQPQSHQIFHFRRIAATKIAYDCYTKWQIAPLHLHTSSIAPHKLGALQLPKSHTAYACYTKWQFAAASHTVARLSLQPAPLPGCPFLVQPKPTAFVGDVYIMPSWFYKISPKVWYTPKNQHETPNERIPFWKRVHFQLQTVCFRGSMTQYDLQDLGCLHLFCEGFMNQKKKGGGPLEWRAPRC